jgi:7-alpha-hydroxysteroid dehydrogenase
MAAPLAGDSVIVSGGGTGIGAAAAARLAGDGAHITICGRTESRLAETADRIEAELGGRGGSVRTVVADVTVEADVARLVEVACARTGGLTGVFANAGGGGVSLPYHLQPVDEFVRVLELNVLGTMLLVKHAVPHLVASGRGAFVGMSSISGHLTKRYGGAYTVAKAGVEQIIRNAADEYGAAGVRFNAVRPGFIATEIMEAIPRDSAVYASYVDNTPLAGVGEPDDVAHLVRFLLGPESRWITGQVINVDGGQSLRKGPDYTPALEPRFGMDVLLARRPPP